MIHRARIVFVAALVVSLVIVATEFPLGQLLHERTVIATTGAELQRLQAANRSLAGQISSLHQPATVGRIAHEEYGLVQKGQSSIVVLPSPGDGGGVDPLATSGIPSSNIVPSDALVASPATTGSGTEQGFWSRLLNRLEFWKAAR